MVTRRAWARLLAVGVVVLTGCDAFLAAPSAGEPAAATPSAPDRSILLLRGHRTELRLEANSSVNSGPAEAMLTERVRTVSNVEVSEGSGLSIENPEVTVVGAFAASVVGSKVGVFELRLRYLDDRNEEHVDVFTVEVAEHHHTEVRFSCWNGRTSSEAPLFAAGAPIEFSASAIDSSGRTLAFDHDFVLDLGGLDRQHPEPGRYTWKLAGAEARAAVLEVYDPAALAPVLDDSPVSFEPLRVVEADAEVDGRAVCTYPTGLVVDYEVVSGGCQPSLLGLEFPEGVTFSIGQDVRHERPLPFSGNGACRVRATLSTGKQADIEFEIPSKTEDPLAEGRELGPEPMEMSPNGRSAPVENFETCPNIRVITDGRCEKLFDDGEVDEDCITGIEWRYELLEPGDEEPLEGWAMGTGLRARLRLGVDLRALGFILQEAQPPSELQFDQDPATGLELEDLGCSTRWHNFDVLPFEPASYVLEAHANNAFDSRKLYLDVRDVARTSLELIDVREPEPADPTVGVVERDDHSLRHLFVGNERALRLQYLDAEGGRLRGVAPLVATAENPSAIAGPLGVGEWFLDSGDEANRIVLSSPVTDWHHVIEVETEEGIATILGVDGELGPLGPELCVLPEPLANDGLPILGVAPVRPQVRGARGKVMVVESRELIGVCFQATEPGPVELDWSWGGATKRTVWWE